MYLSDFQKEIVKAINDKKVKNTETFFREFCDLEEEICVGTKVTNHGVISNGQTINVAADEATILEQAKEFIVLWKALDRADLIISIDSPKPNVKKLVFKKGQKLFPELEAIIIDYTIKEIAFTPELERFYKRGYQTNGEYEQKQERVGREKAQRMTLTIAIITILLSISTVIFNYLTYKIDRNVRITNSSAFRDTLAVKIVYDDDSMEIINDKLLDDPN